MTLQAAQTPSHRVCDQEGDSEWACGRDAAGEERCSVTPAWLLLPALPWWYTPWCWESESQVWPCGWDHCLRSCLERMQTPCIHRDSCPLEWLFWLQRPESQCGCLEKGICCSQMRPRTWSCCCVLHCGICLNGQLFSSEQVGSCWTQHKQCPWHFTKALGVLTHL